MRFIATGPLTGRPLPALALAGALALSIAACGGGAAAGQAATTDPGAAAPTEAPAESVAAAPTPSTVTVQVDQAIWFAGFKVTFGAATAELTPGRGGSVTIEAQFENTGDDSARFDGTLNLASAGENATEGLAMDIPSVPGGQTGKGTLAFDVADSFTLDDAVLTVGRPTNQQAIVPLTASAGTAVTLEPVAVPVSGSGKAGDLKLELRTGEHRADQPWSHGQMEQGSFVLTVTYDASFVSDFAGGFAFSAENVALKLPDGTTVGTIQDGKSQSIELIGPSSTVKDLFSRFEIPDPAAGDYVLLVRSFDNAEAEIPFTIE
jgi:hypothetical protein